MILELDSSESRTIAVEAIVILTLYEQGGVFATTALLLIEFGPPLVGDLDEDGIVDVFDLIDFLVAFDPGGESCAPRVQGLGPCNPADLEEDSDNDVFDLIAMLRALAGG